MNSEKNLTLYIKCSNDDCRPWHADIDANGKSLASFFIGWDDDNPRWSPENVGDTKARTVTIEADCRKTSANFCLTGYQSDFGYLLGCMIRVLGFDYENIKDIQFYW